jgi:hypothetical protein
LILIKTADHTVHYDVPQHNSNNPMEINMQDLNSGNEEFLSTTSFFINKQKIVIRPLKATDTFADFNINSIRRLTNFNVICSPSNWPSVKFKRYTDAEMSGTSIHLALSMENNSKSVLGLGMFTKNSIMRILELGVIVHKDFIDTRLGNELAHSLIREIKLVRPDNILTLLDDGNGLGKNIAKQCGMAEMPCSDTKSKEQYSIFIDSGHHFETS